MKTSVRKLDVKKVSMELFLGILVALSLLALFAKLSNDLLENELVGFDVLVTSYITAFEMPWFTGVMILFTHAGGTYTYVAVVLIGLYILFQNHLKWEALMLVITILGAWGLNEALKAIFQRSRPDIEHLVEAGGYSFPSGHAMVSFAAYGILGYLLSYHRRIKKRQYWSVILLVSLLIFFIGISRIYLHVHYPSDIVAGYAAGGVWLLACVYALTTLNRVMGQSKGI